MRTRRNEATKKTFKISLRVPSCPSWLMPLRFYAAAACIPILLLLAKPNLYAEVSLPSVLADHTVIQRGLPVHVWGKAAEDESVSVTFSGQTKSTTADDLGRWTLYLAPAEAGRPFPMVSS